MDNTTIDKNVKTNKISRDTLTLAKSGNPSETRKNTKIREKV